VALGAWGLQLGAWCLRLISLKNFSQLARYARGSWSCGRRKYQLKSLCLILLLTWFHVLLHQSQDLLQSVCYSFQLCCVHNYSFLNSSYHLQDQLSSLELEAWSLKLAAYSRWPGTIYHVISFLSAGGSDLFFFIIPFILTHTCLLKNTYEQNLARCIGAPQGADFSHYSWSQIHVVKGYPLRIC